MELTNYSLFASDLRNYGIRHAAAHSVALGFSAVEFIDMWNSKDPIPNWLDVEETNRVLKDHDLHVACYSMGVPLQDEPQEENLAKVLREVDLAAKLGSPFFHHTVTMYSVGSRPMIPIGDMLEKVLPSLKTIAKRCAEYGITTLYEPQGAYFNGIAGLDLLINTMRAEGCDNVGFCADIGNCREMDEAAADVFAHFKNDIRHVHLKDYVLTKEVPTGVHYYTSIGGTHMYDCEIGQGNLDFKEAFEVLHSIDYQGAFSIEYGANDASMQRSLAYVKNLW